MDLPAKMREGSQSLVRDCGGDPQNPLSRCVFVIRAKAEHASTVEGVGATPTVVFTDMLPYEDEIEGWRPSIRRKAIEVFILENLEEIIASKLGFSEDMISDIDKLVVFFNLWWTIESARDFYQLKAGVWK